MFKDFIDWMEDHDLQQLLHSAYIDHATYEVLINTREGVRTIFFGLVLIAGAVGMTLGKYLS